MPGNDREGSRGGSAASTLIIRDPRVAAERLAAGGLVAVPTETVYGLAADARNVSAVERVFATKGRPTGHPVILHFAKPDPAVWETDGWIRPGTTTAILDAIAERLWPGPLTIIVGAGERVPNQVTGGRPTVGVRVPDHLLTTRTLALLGGPVAAPSANTFGRVSPTNAHHVVADLGPRLTAGVDAVLDGGATPVGVESTIVDLTTEPPQVLRHGAIDIAALTAVVGAVASDVETNLAAPDPDAMSSSRASGTLRAHYAPSGFVAVAETISEAQELAKEYRSLGVRVALIDRSDDVESAARHLYQDLRTADRDDIDGIVVVAPAPIGLGLAVRDRLSRATAGAAPPNPAR